MVAMMQVLVLPPSESRSRRVSLESLRGADAGGAWEGRSLACVLGKVAYEASGPRPSRNPQRAAAKPQAIAPLPAAPTCRARAPSARRAP
jgi:hypothetical protein